MISCEEWISILLVSWMLTALGFALSYLRNENAFTRGYVQGEKDQKHYQKVVERARARVGGAS